MKKERKIVIIVVITLLIILTLWGSLVYLVDPFNHYHRPWFGLKEFADTSNQAYQILGMAKNFEYDSAIVGSSMTENFRASWFDELYDCKTIKLSYQLGRMENYDLIFDNIFKDREVKNIFFGLDFNAITKAPWQVVLHEMPEYMVNDNTWDDVNYLFNKEVMFDKLLPYLKNNYTNEIPNFDNSYCWGNEYVFSKKEVLNEYLPLRLKQKRKISTMTKLQVMEYCKNNMSVITKYIENNPNTTFYIFYPPFSILVFDDFILKNDFDNCIFAMQYSAEVLLKYDNVKLYLFQNMQDVITNIDLYRDTAHYNEEVNKYMLQCLKEDKYRINKFNYIEEFNSMRQFLENYNYNELLGL